MLFNPLILPDLPDIDAILPSKRKEAMPDLCHSHSWKVGGLMEMSETELRDKRHKQAVRRRKLKRSAEIWAKEWFDLLHTCPVWDELRKI